MQLETLDATVITCVNDNINESEANYEQRIKELENVIEELKSNYEKSINETKEYQVKYLEIKELYDLLVYKRFA
jgi:flagellar biosynthesis component FlhA